MAKLFQGPDLVPENGKVTGPLSENGMFYAEGPTGKVTVSEGMVKVGSVEKQWCDEPGMYYPHEVL